MWRAERLSNCDSSCCLADFVFFFNSFFFQMNFKACDSILADVTELSENFFGANALSFFPVCVFADLG